MKMYLQTLFYISSSWKQWQINCTWVVNLYDDDFFLFLDNVTDKPNQLQNQNQNIREGKAKFNSSLNTLFFTKKDIKNFLWTV